MGSTKIKEGYMSQGEQSRRFVQQHKDLEVYRLAFEAAMTIFHISKKFPIEERYSLTDQIRRSSRAVCANLAEAWRRRRYEGSFLLRLNDSEAEAAETQAWLEFALECGYLQADEMHKLCERYDHIIGKLVHLGGNNHTILR